MSEYIFDVPDSNQPIAGDTGLYYPDERDEPMMVREEIVRCRDCKHYGCYDSSTWCSRTYEQVPSGTCDYQTVEPDGFCAWGERREQ